MNLPHRGLPPDLENLLGRPPTPGEQAERERMIEFAKAEATLQETQRQQILAWQAIFCTCSLHTAKRPSPFTWRPGKAPGQGCQVHGHFMITPDGRVL